MAVHILNGDALLRHFPTEIEGITIIMRECLVDGPVTGDSLPEFFNNRQQFLSAYELEEPDYYLQYVLPELQKMIDLNQQERVYLWFEFDLFCQINLWFICSLMDAKPKPPALYWVVPSIAHKFGFAGMSQLELQHSFKNPISLQPHQIHKMATLWVAWKNRDHNALATMKAGFYDLPGLPDAIDWAVDELSEKRSTQILSEIIAQTTDPTFAKVFRQFYIRAQYLGYGDLQVKRIYRALIEAR